MASTLTGLPSTSLRVIHQVTPAVIRHEEAELPISIRHAHTHSLGSDGRILGGDSLIEQVRGEIKRMEYETMRNLKLLTALKEGKTELVEDQLTGLVVMGISEPDAVTQETINKARDYQSKYCDNKCLGL